MSGAFPSPRDLDVDGFMESSNTGIAAIREQLDIKRRHMREEKARCGNACGRKEDEKTTLRHCSRCHSIRYCSQECQRQHWKVHKPSCYSFNDPPLCRAFNPKIILPGTSYPETPIFARGNKDGMGCWWSVAGQVTCELNSQVGDIMEMYEEHKNKPGTLADAIRMLPGFGEPTYLDIRTLVQNRSSEPRLTVGNDILAIVATSGKEAFLTGRNAGETHVEAQTIRGIPTIAQRPAFVRITHINGKEWKDSRGNEAALLDAVLKDRTTCTFTLQPADHVILNLQYRIGGPDIRHDFEAWALLDHLSLPSMPYVDSVIDSKQGALARMSRVVAPVDMKAVDWWYEDIRTKGEYEHIKSHSGVERANMIGKGNGMMSDTVSMLFGMAMNKMMGNDSQP
ncbi:hypothetical protein K488DRAFT_46051 [Vararia minispora EC-137]|uniref:Uncharacterized protein n=1 Tax=Vararia minispora EC-137 TaxID=1314806 RepID=A0ACB8QRV7_9AGAM|nr:hypothetical protein K488DRAFT_46051 [Vararia minispora EC-137]